MAKRLRSTGRAPSVNLSTLRELLTRYQSEDHPSVKELSAEFELCEATCRKYLRLAIGPLPRGKAAALPRESFSVNTVVNAIETSDLLGAGRMTLLARRHADGIGVSTLAGEFGISRRRVKAAVASF